MNVKTIISLALFFTVAAGIGFYLLHHPELIGHVRDISPWHMILLFLMSVATLAANGLYLRIFAKNSTSISSGRMVWPGLGHGPWEITLPLSRAAWFRGGYLKNRHDFPYAHFLAMLAANYMIAFAVIGLTGVVIMLTLSGTERFSWPVIFFFWQPCRRSCWSCCSLRRRSEAAVVCCVSCNRPWRACNSSSVTGSFCGNSLLSPSSTWWSVHFCFS